MLSRKDFIQISLETNLFFQRIMKEHLFFIGANLPPAAASYIAEAHVLKSSFESLLSESVMLAKGALRKEVLESNELVTPYTLRAEEITAKLTGGSIDTSITKAELNLKHDPNFDYTIELGEKVQDINHRSLNILEEVIKFKTQLHNSVLECKVFTTMYPHMLEHLIREAKLYQGKLEGLIEKKTPEKTVCHELEFWNHIMEDHAEFIDGLLDPTEKELKAKAEEFAKRFELLLEESIKCHEKQLVAKSLDATKDIKNFKKDATQGLLQCEIKSIIPPLLADHVLREANHYLRILKEIKC